MVKECSSCNKNYHYDVDECIFCFNNLLELPTGKLKVVNFTEVTLPTQNHQDTPYFVILAEDERGNLSLKKSKNLPKIGNHVEIEEKDEDTKKITNHPNLFFPSS